MRCSYRIENLAGEAGLKSGQGCFRGTELAVKYLHTVIINRHNRDLFVREMNMASRVRHPNLVQFIGATMEGHPMILMELMPTSLRKVLEDAAEIDLRIPDKQLVAIAVGRCEGSELPPPHHASPHPAPRHQQCQCPHGACAGRLEGKSVRLRIGQFRPPTEDPCSGKPRIRCPRIPQPQEAVSEDGRVQFWSSADRDVHTQVP